MIKFLKKHKLNFISYFFCAFAMALFTIIFFSCKTYAYTIDNDGNLVGDNLCNIESSGSTNGYNFTLEKGGILKFSGSFTSGYNSILIANELIGNTNYTISCEQLKNVSQGFWAYDINNNFLGTTILNNGVATFNYSTTYSLHLIIDNNYYDSINTLYLMLNIGTSPKEWEPYGLWYSENNYDTLQEQYNGLYDSQITNNIKFAFNGAIAKLYDGTNSAPLDQQTPLVQGTLSVDSSYLVTSGDCLAISDYFDNIDYEVVDYPLYTYYIKPNIVFNNSFLIQVSDLTFDYDFTLYYSDGTSQVYNASRLNPPRYTIVVNEERRDILYLTFDLYLPDYAYLEMQMTIDGVSYNTGYTKGYNDGYNWGNTNGYSNGYQNKVSSYENEINSLNNTINTLKDLNAQLQEQISDNLGWSSLFFAFADTPFKVVSNVLGFELFGLNLFATFIGMITVFGVVYLLKKFI